ncbi:hypothetical protein LCGC14_0218140 [marine sediment metagenome]|uniref:Uncharacterized protein n=1 Tax=marine sediment metagenome TaxID=412755 RepID=A0A0F9WYF8_9ZZZZ|nr:hypothetical protein [Maribacter sp.]HDZ03794.1 hypothetical protein [Maribacter sp.]HEA80921.1 hypothetical protein [Maribacter sp.]
MELGIAAIGIASVAICAMPFVVTSRSRKSKEKKMMTSLNDVANKHNCTITEHEIFGHYAIGVDQEKKFVFFFSKSGEVLNQQYADLSTIKTCEIANIGKSYARKEKITERLLLNLFPKNTNEPDTVFEFYDVEVNFQLSGEFQSIQKWNSVIKNLLKS